jgi:hypothetical protein
MPGTKASGRPGGNPEIKKYGFKTNRDEPLRERVQIRVPASMKKKLQEKENWQELVRQALSQILETESA